MVAAWITCQQGQLRLSAPLNQFDFVFQRIVLIRVHWKNMETSGILHGSFRQWIQSINKILQIASNLKKIWATVAAHLRGMGLNPSRKKTP